jgi:hydroxyacylglutathione hydrolase
MTVKVHTIPLGMVNCYLLEGEHTILIDAGVPGQMSTFLKELEKSGVQPEDIELVILTHGHIDHIGLAKEIKELSGCKVAIHQQDREWLESGKSPIPPGISLFGKLVKILGKLMPEMTTAPIAADIVITDAGLSLHDYGIPGRVIHTPGHSPGSVSVLLDSGEAFVGDLAANTPLKRLRPGLPDFADDLGLLKESWKKLLKEEVRLIYPGHGKPFSPEFLHKALA